MKADSVQPWPVDNTDLVARNRRWIGVSTRGGEHQESVTHRTSRTSSEGTPRPLRPVLGEEMV